MIRVHGISPKTCKAFVEPIETRHSAPDPATGEPRDGAELEGLCHECR